MSITDELRKWWVRKFPVMDRELHNEFAAIADRIDAEHEKACDDAWDNGYEADYLGIEKWLTEHPQVMEHHGWVRLPKDADGEYICIGDVMEWCDSGETLTVEGIGSDVLFYIDGENAEWTAARNKRHHHEPTVEDVLREFAYGLGVPVADSYVAAAASKLRLAGENA